MDIELTKIIEDEHRLAVESLRLYGDVFANTNAALICFEQSFIPVDKKAHFSSLFLLQAQKSLCLATLSILRHHRVQMFHMLRDALESEVIACYALHSQNKNEFGEIKDGVLTPQQVLKKGGYDWFKSKYPQESDRIEYLKEMINKSFAHSNLLSVAQNLVVDDNEGKVRSVFFDPVEPSEIERWLWLIGDVAIDFMKIYATVLKNYPVARLDFQFLQKVDHLSAECERIKKRIGEGVGPVI